ncbi:hypothetical protein DUNSADRAFT_778 [Dunaliella salina]|uniref:Encoded protein n=1 Tax=Dunaliella salina TaxID=3046 RepID=A0ABQ7FYF2_DUNSA|nr:hypothetical protein DUNSADRAFT_778 [Dunaliella salina]|eukprot:KAF5827369.1 hypothetical protein DUNSADRAFT_778 [Dunaliella salina]
MTRRFPCRAGSNSDFASRLNNAGTVMSALTRKGSAGAEGVAGRKLEPYFCQLMQAVCRQSISCIEAMLRLRCCFGYAVFAH